MQTHAHPKEVPFAFGNSRFSTQFEAVLCWRHFSHWSESVERGLSIWSNSFIHERMTSQQIIRFIYSPLSREPHEIIWILIMNLLLLLLLLDGAEMNKRCLRYLSKCRNFRTVIAITLNGSLRTFVNICKSTSIVLMVEPIDPSWIIITVKLQRLDHQIITHPKIHHERSHFN